MHLFDCIYSLHLQVSITPFEDEADALRLANDNCFGLGLCVGV